MSTPTVVIYGATSYTATVHLIPYLAAHPDLKSGQFKLVLAGRNKGKIDAVAKAVQLPDGTHPETVALSLDDRPAVDALVQRASVIINLAGPYSLYNAVSLIDSCSYQGKHYVDLSGEVPWISTKVIPRCDFLASKSGAVILPMCGFEAAPGDLSVYHGLRTLQATAGRSVGLSSTINFYDIKGSVSGGTLASVAAGASKEDRKNMGEWALVAPSNREKSPPFKMVFHADAPGAPRVGGFFIGALCNVPTMRRSWSLSRMAPSVLSHGVNTAVDKEALREPRHGPHTTISESMARLGPLHVTSTVTAVIYSSLLLLFGGLYAASSLFRWLCSPFLPAAGQGPSLEDCRKGYTRLTNVSVPDSPVPGRTNPQVVTYYEGKGDPGYSHTARILAEAALGLTLPPPQGTQLPLLATVGGVLTPSTALGMVLIERLRIHGVAEITSEIVEGLGEYEPKKDL